MATGHVFAATASDDACSRRHVTARCGGAACSRSGGKVVPFPQRRASARSTAAPPRRVASLHDGVSRARRPVNPLNDAAARARQPGGRAGAPMWLRERFYGGSCSINTDNGQATVSLTYDTLRCITRWSINEAAAMASLTDLRLELTGRRRRPRGTWFHEGGNGDCRNRRLMSVPAGGNSRQDALTNRRPALLGF